MIFFFTFRLISKGTKITTWPSNQQDGSSFMMHGRAVYTEEHIHKTGNSPF
jgi:hypothetical protein